MPSAPSDVSACPLMRNGDVSELFLSNDVCPSFFPFPFRLFTPCCLCIFFRFANAHVLAPLLLETAELPFPESFRVFLFFAFCPSTLTFFFFDWPI